MRGRRIAGLVALGCCLVAAGCSGRRPMRGQEARGLDRKLAPFAWIEEGDLVTLIVNTQPARYRDESTYVPLQIAVANRGLKKLNLSRESFTLLDAAGNRYPCAAPSELLAGYEFLDLDRAPALADLEGLVADRFAAYARYESRFSPTRAFHAVDPQSGTLRATGGVVHDRVALPKLGYLVDMIYFPRPATGVLGQGFELFLAAPELADPVFVKFEVR
jgi:hypothetical protein